MSFKDAINQLAEDVIKECETSLWFGLIKPIVNLARPELDRMLAENPKQIYDWLKWGHERIGRCLEAYENENR